MGLEAEGLVGEEKDKYYNEKLLFWDQNMFCELITFLFTFLRALCIWATQMHFRIKGRLQKLLFFTRDNKNYYFAQGINDKVSTISTYRIGGVHRLCKMPQMWWICFTSIIIYNSWGRNSDTNLIQQYLSYRLHITF